MLQDWKPWETGEEWNIARIDDARKFETADGALDRRIVRLAAEGGNPDLFQGFA